MALQLSQILQRILSEETINFFELASVDRVGIPYSSETRNMCKIVNPSEVLVPCIWLLEVPDTWLQITENNDCWQFPILPL